MPPEKVTDSKIIKLNSESTMNKHKLPAKKTKLSLIMNNDTELPVEFLR
mgnify:CR=1 FL=1